MTSKDKTRDKLVGSMRKTKAGAGIGTDSGQIESAAATPVVEEKAVEEKVVEKAAAAKTAKPAVKTDKRAGKPAQSAQVSSDSYQSGRRVWPD